MLDNLGGLQNPFVGFFSIWVPPKPSEHRAEPPCECGQPKSPASSPRGGPVASASLTDITKSASRLNAQIDTSVAMGKSPCPPDNVEDAAPSHSSFPNGTACTLPSDQFAEASSSLPRVTVSPTAHSPPLHSQRPTTPSNNEETAGAQDDPVALLSSSPEWSPSILDAWKSSSTSSKGALKRKRALSVEIPRKSPTPARSKSPPIRTIDASVPAHPSSLQQAPLAKDPAPSSSLSVLSRTPELSQPMSKSSYSTPPAGHTSYVVDSEEGDNADSEEAFEEDSSAPKHEPIAPRPLLDLYDSDSSLEDLDTLMLRPEPVSRPRRRTGTSPSSPAQPVRSRPRQLNEPKWNASMMQNLVNQSERAISWNVKLEQAKDALEAIETAQPSVSDVDINESTIADLAKAKEGAPSKERIKQAVDRTDLVAQRATWHFFDASSQNRLQPPYDVPIRIDTRSPWFRRPMLREHAFLSGLAKEKSHSWRSHDEMLTWLWESYLTEPREEMSLAYLGALDDCIGSTIKPKRLQDTFQAMGAKTDCFTAEAKLVPVMENDHGVSQQAPLALKRLLFILRRQTTCPLFKPTIRFALQLLLRLAADSKLLNTGNLFAELRQTLGYLLSELDKDPDNPMERYPLPTGTISKQLQNLSRNLVHCVDHPTLQLSIIQVLPTNTPSTHIFARRLALSFFLSSEAYVTFPLTSTRALSKAVSNAIVNSSLFMSTDAKGDYPSLKACIELLDFAIADGFGRPHADAPRESRRAFDDHVDGIIAALSQLSARIVDTGASHMQRTEAKASVSRLLVRLEHAVRTEPKPPVHVFDDVAWNHSIGSASKSGASRDARAQALRPETELMSNYFRPKVTNPKAVAERSPPRATFSEASPSGSCPSSPIRADEATARNAAGGAKDQTADVADDARPSTRAPGAPGDSARPADLKHVA